MRIVLMLAGGCLACLPAGPAAAQLDPKGTGNCRVGLSVATRDGRVGKVEDAQGNSCHVRFPDGSRDYFQQWMLKPGGRSPSPTAASGRGSGAPAGPAGAGAVRPGNYQCFGGAAGNMRITLTGNRWKEFYAAALPDGRVGLSSRPNGRPYYMICERR
ncbi:MAG TPA: hypothetical protein VF574_14490 [Allosphingosinicella sp.]|jgi:hypothetical protein